MGLVKGKTLFKVFHIDIILSKILTKNSHETRARSPRGGLTMGRTAEGRSELAELALSLIHI